MIWLPIAGPLRQQPLDSLQGVQRGLRDPELRRRVRGGTDGTGPRESKLIVVGTLKTCTASSYATYAYPICTPFPRDHRLVQALQSHAVDLLSFLVQF